MILGMCLHCKKEFRKREIKYKFCSLICSSNFNKNGLKKIIPPKPSESLAEFIGICLGDGYIGRYQTAITLNTNADKEYIPYVITLIKKLFPTVTVSLVNKVKENATDVRINSILVSQFLLAMGLTPKNKIIPKWILRNNSYRKVCVRGLFDTEGSISFKIYKSKKGISVYKQLNFRNVDVNFMIFVRDTLVTLGFKPTMTLKKSLYLSNHQAIEVFRRNIGFSNPKLLIRSFICTIQDYETWKSASLLTPSSTVV